MTRHISDRRVDGPPGPIVGTDGLPRMQSAWRGGTQREGTVTPQRCKNGWWLLSRSFYSKRHTAGPTVKTGPGPGPPAGQIKPKPTSRLVFRLPAGSQAEGFTASSHRQTARPIPDRTPVSALSSSQRGEPPSPRRRVCSSRHGNGAQRTSPLPSKPAASIWWKANR